MSNTAVPAPPTYDVVPSSRLEPLRPMPLHEVQRAMQEYQAGLEAILDPVEDYQRFTANDGSDKRFVVKTGWRKIATWFGLDLLLDEHRITVDRDANGKALRARVIGRVVAPNGRAAEDVAVCDASERHFSKLEHDLVATAATRALNRATSNLVGMGEVSAEEIADNVEPLLPLWAQAADDELLHEMVDLLTELYGPERALALGRGLDNRYGYVPNIVAGIVRAMHRMWQSRPEDLSHVDTPPTSEPTPDQ